MSPILTADVLIDLVRALAWPGCVVACAWIAARAWRR
jgi:hypothetical protein